MVPQTLLKTASATRQALVTTDIICGDDAVAVDVERGGCQKREGAPTVTTSTFLAEPET